MPLLPRQSAIRRDRRGRASSSRHGEEMLPLAFLKIGLSFSVDLLLCRFASFSLSVWCLSRSSPSSSISRPLDHLAWIHRERRKTRMCNIACLDIIPTHGRASRPLVLVCGEKREVVGWRSI
ncbi:hypothetical protein ACLOJK_012532, partial [Asimina triloba]